MMRVKSDAEVENYAKWLVQRYGDRSSFIAQISTDGLDGSNGLASRQTWGRIQRALAQIQNASREHPVAGSARSRAGDNSQEWLREVS